MATQALRSNLRFSHMARARYKPTNNSGMVLGGSDFNIKASDFFTQRNVFQGIGGQNPPAGMIYTVRNAFGGFRSNGSGGYNTEPQPNFFRWEKGRYKSSSTATPTNVDLPAGQDNVATTGHGNATNMNLSKFTGVHQCVLTTDNCGRTRGAKSPGYTTNVVSKGIGDHFYFQGDTSGANFGAKTRKPTEGSSSAGQQALSSSDVGYSVYTTYHNNQWVHLGLNTTAAAGDRVIVIAQSEGGTMYDFANDSNDAIYVRTEGNSAISGNTYHVHQAPHKNETGTDDWVAIYSVVVGSSGGGQVVLVNPWHSGTSRYIWHVFVVKGPNTYIYGSSGYNKYTQPDSTPQLSFANAQAALGQIGTAQYWTIGVATSPFTSNGYNVTIPSVATTYPYDMQFNSGFSYSDVGAWNTTICNFTGRVDGSIGKFGTTYSFGGYSPGWGRLGPRQDYRWVYLTGWRY